MGIQSPVLLFHLRGGGEQKEKQIKDQSQTL